MLVATSPTLVRSMPWSASLAADTTPLLTREWLVTNGLGGYASGTVGNVATRRYHGLLVAALPAPLGRIMVFNGLSERLELPDGRKVRLGGRERPDSLEVPDAQSLREFRLEDGLPVWRFDLGTHVYERQVVLPHHQNTVHIIYHLIEGDGRLRLRLRPYLNIRDHDAPVGTPLAEPYKFTATADRFEVASANPAMPALRLHALGDEARFVYEPLLDKTRFYRVEKARGYSDQGMQWRPGTFEMDLGPDRPVMLTGSVEPWGRLLALDPEAALEAERGRRRRLLEAADPRASEGLAAELVLAADQFLIRPAGRVEDAARAEAVGDEVRTVVAGYHWFTDWGRDTMISLEGLTLVTGRHREAGYILRTFAQYVRDGLIPNYFPDGQNEGLYHTADATMWYFHALGRYLEATGDVETLRGLLPTLHDIVAHHLRGTRFGIGVDPNDGLLRQGMEGYQLTWMDAKMGDWVVTPRRGKAVEINALWYNSLRLLAGWSRDEGDTTAADELMHHADRAQASFNRRFWNPTRGYLFDVVDGEEGDDPACRPNQVFAISLPHPVLARENWAPVLHTVRDRLLTPVGLRSLDPSHPQYRPTYDGDLHTRDGAYHQGTVWAWLIGPYMDAWRKLDPTAPDAGRCVLEGFEGQLGEACLGTISEIFDAEPPYTPRGCVAQAWSVAEVLRGWVQAGASAECP
jgi:predicted glycogen debranching enzyme